MLLANDFVNQANLREAWDPNAPKDQCTFAFSCSPEAIAKDQALVVVHSEEKSGHVERQSPDKEEEADEEETDSEEGVSQTTERK